MRSEIALQQQHWDCTDATLNNHLTAAEGAHNVGVVAQPSS